MAVIVTLWAAKVISKRGGHNMLEWFKKG